jgi:hypothetical protein
MWIEKLRDGVLQLSSPMGPRYVQPNLLQRAYLIWMFRNFVCLPQQVLLPWECRLIDHLWSRNRFVSLAVAGSPDRPVIGKVERKIEAGAESRPQHRQHEQAPRLLPIHGEVVPIRKPAATTKAAKAEPNREAASA